MIFKVKMYTNIDWFLVENVRPVMVNSCVKFLHCEADILLSTFFACYRVYKVFGCARKIVSNGVGYVCFCRSKMVVAIQVFTC